MPCCCTHTLNLCNIPVCGRIEFRQAATAAESGAANLYTLVLDYLDTLVTLVALQTEGENISFDVSKLNENFQYTGQIFDSAGEVVSIEDSPNTYDCVKFKTILSLNAESATSLPAVLVVAGTVVIECVTDEEPVITGSTNPCFGIVDGSITITSDDFVGVRVIVIRGNIPIPGIDPLDGSNFFTKILANDFITLSEPLASGEFIRIQTIPE